MKKIITILMSFISVLAMGATTTGTNKSTATLANSCTIQTQDVSFGNYVPTAQSNTSQNINILCTRGTSYTISSKAGGTAQTFPWSLPTMTNNPYHAGGVMTSTTDSSQHIYYEQYYAWAGYWDQDMDLAAQQYTSTGTGVVQTINIPYRLVAGQYAAPGNYVGSHTMTVTF